MLRRYIEVTEAMRKLPTILRVCVAAKSRVSARSLGKRIAKKELRARVLIRKVAVSRGCDWMPEG